MKVNETKETILTVATRLFSRFGFHKTSMDEIAKIARKAKGSLYYHFESKEDLFREVISNEMNYLKDQLTIIVNNPNLPAFEKLKSYLLKRMEVMNTMTNYHETLYADFFEHFHFIDDKRAELDNWEKNSIKKIIEQGLSSDEFTIESDVNVILDIFMMVLKGIETPFFLQKKYEHYFPYFEGLINILQKGIVK